MKDSANSKRSRIVTLAALVTAAAAACVPLFGEELDVQFVRPALPPARGAAEAPSTRPVDVVIPKGRERDPANPMERAAESGASVYVSDSFPAVDQLRKAIDFTRRGQSRQAIDEFQAIMDKYGQKLVFLNDNSFASITDYCREWLLKIPDVSRGMYDDIYGGQAREAIEPAIAQRDVAGLARACDRFFCASVALTGLNQAAEWYFERGEFSTAARTWQQLLTHPRATADQKAEFLHHAILAEKLSGRIDVARKLRDRLASEYADATGTVSGSTVKLVESADQMLVGAPWESVAVVPDEWPQMGGSPRRDVIQDVNASAKARLWSLGFDDESIAGDAPRRLLRPAARPMPGYGRRVVVSDGPQLTSFPVLSNGTMLIHTGDRVAALSGNAGTVLWTYPPASQFVPARSPEQEQQMISNYGMAMRMPSVDACAIFENQVYAVLPAGGSAGGGGRGYYYYGYMPMMNTKLVAINRTDGKEIWTKPVVASEIPMKEGTGSLSFMGPPTVTRQGVFVMAKRTGGDNFTQFYLVRLDRLSGEVSWVCYLCSAGGQGYMPSPSANRIPIPTIADDVVYISTGQGAEVAVDANAGRIQWLQITDTAKIKPATPVYYGMNVEQTPSWKFNAPLIYGDKLVTYEINGWVRVYDRWNGKLLWKKERKELGNTEVLAGFHGNLLILVGSGDQGIKAINMDTYKEEWAMDPRAGEKMQGRPFLAKNLLYIPHQGGLRIIDLNKKAEIDFSAWPKNDKDEMGKAGNMLVTSEQIIVVSDREVAGYSRWETARDNRLADIARRPADPEPYLMLAEIAFRTDHLQMGEEYFAKSVQLAIKPDAATPEELRQRLYRTSLNFAEQLLEKSDTDQRARARFYYEQCKLTAYNAETQAEWRLSMAGLSLAQSKWPEAAELYNAVMNDTSLRSSSFKRGDTLARAGVAAEQQMKSLIERLGKQQVTSSDSADYAAQVEAAGRAAVYRPFETLAATSLKKARAEQGNGRIVALASVVDGFPNSESAIGAAMDLAAAYRGASQYVESIKTLRWLYPRVYGNTRAQVIADLSTAHAAINRWTAALSWADRGSRAYKDVAVTEGGRSTTFAALRDGLRARTPGNVEGRRPSLPMPRATKEDASKLMVIGGMPVEFGKGFLLAPIETSAAHRQPDSFFVFYQGRIRMIDPSVGLKDRWTTGGETGVALPDNSPVVLLGSSGDTAVFVQATQVLGIDIAKGTLKWTQPLSMTGEERTRINEIRQRIQQIQQQEAQMRGGGMVVDPDTGSYYSVGMLPSAMSADPEYARAAAFRDQLGAENAQFSTMRIVGNKLIVVGGSTLTAFDITTGQRAWKDRATVALAEGAPSALLANEDRIVVQTDNERGVPTFRVFETSSGKFVGEAKLDEERALWRGLSEDGTLFVVTNQSVSAYDCFDLGNGAGGKKALWRRDDLKVKWASASAITLDGLVLVNDSSQLVCLSAESGSYRWPIPPATPPQLILPTSTQQGGWTYLRSYVEGDQIIYQSQTGLSAYYSADGDVSWHSSMVEGDHKAQYPPLGASQLADPYLVTLASGIKKNGTRGAMIIAHDRRPGKGRLMNLELQKSAANPDPPVIRQWQVVDNGIVMESRGLIFVCRAKPAE